MNIIFGQQNLAEIDDKYILLELDIVKVKDSLIPSYCLVEKIGLQDVVALDNHRDLHAKFVKNYRLKNWSFCEQAIEHLLGKWNGELDSFYLEISRRIALFKETAPPDDWDGSYSPLTSA